MNFQVFHVNPGKKLKKKDVNNDLSHFMSVFPIEKSSNFCKNLQKNQEIYTKEFLPILTTTGTITIHIHITQVSLQIFKP